MMIAIGRVLGAALTVAVPLHIDSARFVTVGALAPAAHSALNAARQGRRYRFYKRLTTPRPTIISIGPAQSRTAEIGR